MPTPSVTTRSSNWGFQNSSIERLMDHAALTSAHPDNTLILAGPPRYQDGANGSNDFFSKLLPLGMVQNFQVGQTLPVNPMMAIGSSRSFYLIGKAQGSASIARLFCNGRNLTRALHTNLHQDTNFNPVNLDDPAATGINPNTYFNLDSELFRVPLGLACFFYDKLHNSLGAFYLELCQIQSWALGFGAGQNMILENVNLLFDRLYPINANGVQTGGETSETSQASMLAKATEGSNPNPLPEADNY